jgi:hypothetical protein
MRRSRKQPDSSVIGVRPIDTDASRRAAEAKGKGDGSRRFPLVTGTSDKAVDYEGAGQQAEAKTTETLILGTHLGNKRVEIDTRLGEARATTSRRTTRTTDARKQLEDALAENRGFQQSMPISGKAPFWSVRTVTAVLFVLAVGSGAAIIAALQGATEDREWLSYLVGSGVAVAVLVLGAVIGVHLRRRDLDDLKGGQYAAHTRRWWFLLAVGVLGVVALARGVAGLREASSNADAVRRANQTQVDVFLPGQQAQAPSLPSTSDHPGTVSWTMWFLFEFGVAVAAVFVEYHRADARVEWGERLAKQEEGAQEVWDKNHDQLRTAVGEHEGLVMARADFDASTILVGQAHPQWADRLTHAYRYGNSSSRAEGGDPFGHQGPVGEVPLVKRFGNIPGTDLPVMAPINGDSTASTPLQFRGQADWSDREHMDIIILARAHDELGTVPSRPERHDAAPWTPARDLAADPQVVALDAAFAKRQAELARAKKTAGNGSAEPEMNLSELEKFTPSAGTGGGS